MPNPMPLSGNCDVVRIWDGHSTGQVQNNQTAQPTNNAVNQINNIANNVSLNNNFNTANETPIQEPTNVGIPELSPSDLEIQKQDITPINNTPKDISEIPKEEENKTTFNIGVEQNNISNPSLDFLSNNQTKEQPSMTNSPIPEININNNETL